MAERGRETVCHRVGSSGNDASRRKRPARSTAKPSRLTPTPGTADRTVGSRRRWCPGHSRFHRAPRPYRRRAGEHRRRYRRAAAGCRRRIRRSGCPRTRTGGSCPPFRSGPAAPPWRAIVAIGVSDRSLRECRTRCADRRAKRRRGWRNRRSSRTIRLRGPGPRTGSSARVRSRVRGTRQRRVPWQRSAAKPLHPKQSLPNVGSRRRDVQAPRSRLAGRRRPR